MLGEPGCVVASQAAGIPASSMLQPSANMLDYVPPENAIGDDGLPADTVVDFNIEVPNFPPWPPSPSKPAKPAKHGNHSLIVPHEAQRATYQTTILWAELPADLLIDIALKTMNGSSSVKYEFNMPTARDGQGTLKVLSQVCSTWRSALMECPLLWRVHVRSKASKKLNASQLQFNNYDHAGDFAATILLSGHMLFAAETTIHDVLEAKDAVRQCTQLAELDLTSTLLVEGSAFEELFILSDLKALLSSLPSFKKVWLPAVLLSKPMWAELVDEINCNGGYDTCDACDFKIAKNDSDDEVYDEDDDDDARSRCGECNHVFCSEDHGDGIASIHRKWNRQLIAQPHAALVQYLQHPDGQDQEFGLGLTCENCSEYKCKACGSVSWCDECDTATCMGCCPVYTCDKCNESKCMECCPTNHCEGEGCNKSSCMDCMEVQWCESCNEGWCSDCRLSLWCDTCDKVKCMECADFSECSSCKSMICSDCDIKKHRHIDILNGHNVVCTKCRTKKIDEAAKAMHLSSSKVGSRLNAKLAKKNANKSVDEAAAETKKHRSEALFRDDSEFAALANATLNEDTRDIDALVADISGPSKGGGGNVDRKAKMKKKKKKKKK